MGGYVFQPYPKCKYHPDGRLRIVENAGEELALGRDWSDTLPVPAPPPTEETPIVVSPTPEPPRRRGRPRKPLEAP